MFMALIYISDRGAKEAWRSQVGTSYIGLSEYLDCGFESERYSTFLLRIVHQSVITEDVSAHLRIV